ncbi:tryptophan-rich sensory protein [Parvibaculum indicum]|uniref:TspO/MBR family protein n=1 Tax=Parvibaculum indicum TaxID=562969 RepID=UPI001962A9C5|nr:TspO/MBR family protein [Parvibaculum indicum]NIJ41810.1 tryptophan-rich sensory protein [Parvibaculum indicum]
MNDSTRTGQEKGGATGSAEGEDYETPRTGVSVFMLFAALVLVFAVAGVGGGITATSVNDWYPSLIKPALTPPPWAFPVVWNLLYFLIALAAWLVWLRVGSLSAAGAALSLFGSQLMLNLGWAVLFFGLKAPGFALAEIPVLLIVIVLTIVAFCRHSPLAGMLMLPYFFWVCFATYLNAGIWLLNG